MTHSLFMTPFGIIVRIVALALLASAPSASALEADAEAPILIEANTVEMREDESLSIYAGQVVIEQGSMRLLANHVTVYHRPNRQPRLIIALGEPARYRQKLDRQPGDDTPAEVTASARRMEYDADRQLLTLLGHAVLVMGEDRLTGEHILYDRAKTQFRAGGERRVKIKIAPRQD